MPFANVGAVVVLLELLLICDRAVTRRSMLSVLLLDAGFDVVAVVVSGAWGGCCDVG